MLAQSKFGERYPHGWCTDITCDECGTVCSGHVHRYQENDAEGLTAMQPCLPLYWHCCISWGGISEFQSARGTEATNLPRFARYDSTTCTIHKVTQRTRQWPRMNLCFMRWIQLKRLKEDREGLRPRIEVIAVVSVFVSVNFHNIEVEDIFFDLSNTPMKQRHIEYLAEFLGSSWLSLLARG